MGRMPTWYSEETPRPGLDPSGPRTAGTMVAALHGTLVPHAWRDSDQDAYSLFVQHAAALGWTSESGGLWQMNDAGWEHPRARGQGLVAWFQVEAAMPGHEASLPAAALLRCAVETADRAGTLDLTGVQLLLPVQALRRARPRPGGPPSLRSRHWYAEASPAARTPVEVTVSTAAPEALRRLGDWFAGLEQSVLLGVEQGVTDSEPPSAPFAEAFGGGASRQRAVLVGELCEWSADAVGWVAETAVEGVADLGGSAPTLVSVTRRTAVA